MATSAIQDGIPKTMRAWQYSSARGGLENAITLVDKPVPTKWRQRKPGWELIQVESMTLNPADYKVPEKLWLTWLLTPKPAIPGFDFAGTAVGGSLDGQRVFGRIDHPYQYGALAQYLLVKSESIAEIPDGVSFEHAAALGSGAASAYQTLVPFVKPGQGTRVFINGGSGGVGTFSIQMAKLLGCYVVTSCSSRNVDLCKSLGADEVIDYTKVEGGDVGVELGLRVLAGKLKEFDLVVDNVGSDPGLHRKSAAFLSKNGLFLLLAATDNDLAGVGSMVSSWLRPTWLGGIPRRWKFIMATDNPKATAQIRDWVAAGKLKSVIDEVFKFEEAPRAYAKLRTGRARGRIVVTGISSQPQ